MADARPRLRRRPRAEPGHHHGHDVPARADGPGRQARRLRLPRRRGQRLLRDHRLGRPPAGRAVQRLHRHHRAALPGDRAAGRARPPPPHRRGPVHRPGADGVGAALPRARAARRPGRPASSARRAGNHDPDAAPHDAYPCAGVDQWCAIAVETDEQWRALRRALGDAGVGDGPGARHREPAASPSASCIDRELAAFTARHEPRAS